LLPDLPCHLQFLDFDPTDLC